MKRIGNRILCRALTVLILGTSATRAATGVWIKATGGYWSDEANWQDGYVPRNAPDVADFSALGSGETITITHDIGVGAMVFDGPPDAEWSIQTEDGAKLGFDVTPITSDFAGGEIRVTGGTLTLWPNLYFAKRGIVKSGSGRLRLVSRYESVLANIRLDDGTLILSNRAALVDSVVIMNATNALLYLESDAEVDGIQSWVSPAPDIALNGFTLELGGTQHPLDWEGRLTGGGRLVMVRGALQSMPSSQLDLESVTLDNGSLTIGKPTGRTVAWWRFDDENDIGKDSGPLANHLVKIGTATQWHLHDDVRGGVLSLDNGAYLAGQGTGLSVVGIPTNNSPFTVALWLKPSAGVHQSAILFGWGTVNTARKGIGMRLKLDTPGTPIMMADWVGNPTLPYAGDLLDGRWHHVAMVYTGEQFHFYIDGELVRSFTENGELALTAGNFRLGFGWLGSDTAYTGLMDDLMIADWAMSRGELFAVRVNGQEPDTSVYAVNNPLPATAAIEVGFIGNLHLVGDQTVATLGGEGAAGCIHLKNGGILTVNGGATATSTVFRSGITGDGSLVKQGADYTLTLSGGHAYTGATEVQEGKLVLGSGLDVAGLQAYYRFNDPNQLGKDSSGNGYHLIPSNSPIFAAAGKDGGAARFSSANHDMLVADGFPETFPRGDQSYTMTAWCNPSVGNKQGMAVFWGSSTSGSASGAGVIFRFASDTEILVSNFGNNKIISAGYNLFDDALNGGWHHFACTYDSVTRIRRVYIDGVLNDTENRTTVLSVSPQVFQLGGAPYSTANYYDGLLDEVMIFNKTLNQGEVQQVMALTMASYRSVWHSTNLVARYRFEDELNPGKDSSANGYDLTAFGSARVAASGKRGKALDLSGSSIGYLFWADSVVPPLLPTGNQTMTVSAWFNPVTDADTDGSIVFWGDEGTPSYKGCHLIRLRGGFDSGRMGISYTDGATPNLQTDIVNGLDRGIWPEGWHHVAAVYDGDGRELYLDGVKVAEDTRAGLNVARDGFSFYIGRKETLPAKWFQGMIDEVEIYNRALSHTEVLELLRGGMDILPASTALNVAENATAEVHDVIQQVAALNGTGTLTFKRGSLTVSGQGGWFAGALKGEGAFTVRDGAVQTLAGAGSFIGMVIVTNATLLVENDSGTVTAAGNVIVQAGGRIGGQGTIGGDLSIEACGGIVAAAEPDSLEVTGAVTLGATGTVVLPPGFTGGRLTLLIATAVTAPEGLAGWKVEPQPSASTSVTFAVVGTQFSVNVSGKGTLLQVR
ncbi:MAG TPA: hypothetical protein P5026_04950 [Kiritimatiellia bacterium]|nr:hypothetical protein [Kiritimatiellia bacterium]